MKITKHGQSCLHIESAEGGVLVDPGIFVFNEEGIKPEDFQDIKVLIFTHEHPDHFDIENVKKIIESNNPKILATRAVCDQLPDDTEATVAKAGEQYEFNGFKITSYESTHGPLPTGTEPPEVIGFKIEDGEGRSVYTPGDTIKLADTDADIVAVPICGQVVLGIEEAKSELDRVGAKVAIPIHYDNPRFPVDVKEFETLMQNADTEVRVLAWGKNTETYS